MEIRINRDSVIPIYTQIYNSIRTMILSGAMPAGYKLPPERKLAEQLGVNRSTVLNAYRELKAIGLIDSHIGQGTTVADLRGGYSSGEDPAHMTSRAGGITDRLDGTIAYGRMHISEGIDDAVGGSIKAGSIVSDGAIAGSEMAGSAVVDGPMISGPMTSGPMTSGPMTSGQKTDGRMSMTGGAATGNRTTIAGDNAVMAGGVKGLMAGSAIAGGRTVENYFASGMNTDSSRYGNPQMPPMPWEQLFSESSMRTQDTTVRDLLKLSGRKDMILFAAGVTAPGMDSLEALQRIQTEVVKDYGHTAVQHLPADGFYPLRESITKLMSDRGINASAEETMVLSGSQQGLDLVARVFIDPGDTVFVEEPTFFSAIHIFRAAGARVVGVPTDSSGIRTDVLSLLLKRFKPKLIYTIPDFQNPSGAVMSIERRRELLSLASRNQIIILEDDPYGKLRYEGNTMPALKAMDVYNNVLYLSTFSKLLFPGFRVGWISGPPQVLHRLTLLKQTADLHTSSLPQLIFDRFLREGLMNGHLERAIKENRKRRDVMHEELTEAGLEGLSWNRPEGGLYLWCRLPDIMQQSRLLSCSVDNGVSFVPGNTFFPGNATGSYIRLNFTYPTPEQIKEGVRRLAAAYRNVLEEQKNNIGEIHSMLGPIL